MIDYFRFSGHPLVLFHQVIRAFFDVFKCSWSGVDLPICTNMTHILFHYCKLPADRYKPNCPPEGWDQQLWDRQFIGQRELAELKRWSKHILKLTGGLKVSLHPWEEVPNATVYSKYSPKICKANSYVMMLRDGQRCVSPCSVSEFPYTVFHKPRARWASSSISSLLGLSY